MSEVRRKMTFSEQFAKNIQKARHAKGLKQIALARMIGVTHNCISLYETARRTPSLRTAVLISRVLDVPLGDLVPCDLVSCDMLVDPSQTNIFDYIEEDKDEWK